MITEKVIYKLSDRFVDKTNTISQRPCNFFNWKDILDRNCEKPIYVINYKMIKDIVIALLDAL